MKKAVSLILVLVMCLSLCACTSEEKMEEKIKDAVVGDWEYIDSDGNRHYMEIRRGGTGADEDTYKSGRIFSCLITWEVEDGDICIRGEVGGMPYTNWYTYDAKNDTLVQDNGTVYSRED